MTKYHDNTKAGLIIARGRFELDIYHSNYLFDINSVFEILEEMPTVVGVFVNPQSVFQKGLLLILDKCESVYELEQCLSYLEDAYVCCKECEGLFVAYSQTSVNYAFCNHGYSFIFSFPRLFINYADKEHVDYVSKIEEENLKFAIQIAKKMSLVEKINIDFEDRALLQDFCEKHASSYISKNAFDDYCFANKIGIISKKILLNLLHEVHNIMNVFSTIDNYVDKEDETTLSYTGVIELLNKYINIYS